MEDIESENEYLFCEVDPYSVLLEPIETLRKHILKESDEEDKSLTMRSDSDESDRKMENLNIKEEEIEESL